MDEKSAGSPEHDPFVDLTGQEIGPYRLLEAIGRGGMSTVYRAHDSRTAEEVALKVLHPQLILDRRFPERFMREAKVLRKLDHPHVVPVLDYGQEGDLLYIAMPWMKLGSLNDRLAKGYLSPPEGARLISQIADALNYAHKRGVIHRDVKPGNILLNHQGNALLSDFGFVHLSDASMSLTGSAMVGTPAYISPEQALGDEVTPASDQYALAVILYQITTGLLPYEADTPMGMAIKHATQPLPAPRSVNPNIPNAVEAVLQQALAKDPADRFSSILDFNQAFQDALIASVDIPSGRLKRGAISEKAQTLELTKEELGLQEESGKRKRQTAILAGLLALLLVGCPASIWAFRSLGGELFSTNSPSDPLQPTADMTQTAQTIITALAPSGGTVLSPETIQTAVAATVAALPTQTALPVLVESTTPITGTLTEIEGSITPTEMGAAASATSPPPDTSTPRPAATNTPGASPTASTSPTPTGSPTPTATATPLPTDTPLPTATNTVDICTLIDYQSAGRNGQEYSIRIENNTGQQIQITDVRLVWPGSNEELKKVELGGSEIWSGEDENPPTNFSCSGTACRINTGANKTLVAFFGEDAASSGYSLRLTYTNGCVVEEGF